MNSIMAVNATWIFPSDKDRLQNHHWSECVTAFTAPATEPAGGTEMLPFFAFWIRNWSPALIKPLQRPSVSNRLQQLPVCVATKPEQPPLCPQLTPIDPAVPQTDENNQSAALRRFRPEIAAVLITFQRNTDVGRRHQHLSSGDTVACRLTLNLWSPETAMFSTSIKGIQSFSFKCYIELNRFLFFNLCFVF